jgi:hypothetical protein
MYSARPVAGRGGADPTLLSAVAGVAGFWRETAMCTPMHGAGTECTVTSAGVPTCTDPARGGALRAAEKRPKTRHQCQGSASPGGQGRGMPPQTAGGGHYSAVQQCLLYGLVHPAPDESSEAPHCSVSVAGRQASGRRSGHPPNVAAC